MWMSNGLLYMAPCSTAFNGIDNDRVAKEHFFAAIQKIFFNFEVRDQGQDLHNHINNMIPQGSP